MTKNPKSAVYPIPADENGKAIKPASVTRFEFVIETKDGVVVRSFSDTVVEAGQQTTAIPQDLPDGDYKISGRVVTDESGDLGPKYDFTVGPGKPGPLLFSLA